MLWKRLAEEAKQTGHHAWIVLRDAVQSFGAAHAPQAAAALAYYTFFSLFPLLLVLVAGMSFLLAGARAQQEAINFIQQALPISQDLVRQNVERVLSLRGPVSIVGLVSLLWSATSVFNTITHHVNRAWEGAEARSFIARRLVALGMVVALFVLLLLSLASTTIINLLPSLEIPIIGESLSIYNTVLWTLGARLVPWLFTLVMFLALYRWVPNTDVHWRAALLGAVVAGVAWELAKSGFAWYVRSGMVEYELVYGSLGAVVALLFWVYLSGLIMLFGAHISATLDRQLRSEPETSSKKHAFVVFNPVAGTGDADEVRNALEHMLSEVGWTYTIHKTRSDEEIAEVVRGALDESYDLFLASGGDGTVSGVAGALVGTDMPVGVVPTGTGNAMARELGLPLDVEQACAIITGDPASRYIDALRVGDRYAFLNLTIGLSAQAILDTDRNEKQSLGILAYLLEGSRNLAEVQPAHFEVIVDDETYDLEATDVVVANSGSIGGLSDFRLDPEIRFDDGHADVCFVRASRTEDVLQLLWDTLRDQQEGDPHLDCVPVYESVEITADRALPVQADGESLGDTSVCVTVVPEAVRFIVPRKEG
jgi:YegS/Rv2252/BmrU family lipid kinase